MLKNILTTSVALVLSTAAITANASDNQQPTSGGNNFSSIPATPLSSSSVPTHKIQPPVITPFDHFPAIPINSSSDVQSLSGVPAQDIQPAPVVPQRDLEKPSKVPITKIQPAKKATVYQGLESGYRAGIEINRDKCTLTKDSNEPIADVRFNNYLFSTRDGVKLTFDPNGNARNVYHFSNRFHVFTRDSNEFRGTRFAEVDPNGAFVVVKITAAQQGQDGMAPVWNYYRFNCGNDALSFQMK